MEIVVNEWLLEYLRPDADESNKINAIKFVNAFVGRNDKIVIKRNSPFVNKFHNFMKLFGWDSDFKNRFSKLHNLLFCNSDKTIIVNYGDTKKLPQEIADITPPDDLYLMELWYLNQDRIVLTTDERLKDKLQQVNGLKICLLNEFLQKYL